jgi:hypothetical protein
MYPVKQNITSNGMPIGKKKSSKVRDKWQRKLLGMPIYAVSGSPLFLMLPNYVPNGNIVFHGHHLCIQNFLIQNSANLFHRCSNERERETFYQF